MNSRACVLSPAAAYLPGLESGEFRLDRGEHRIVRSESEDIVASLVPGKKLQGELAKLPLNPDRATEVVSESSSLSSVAPLLARMQATSTVGALGSVASPGVSCVQFATPLARLARIDGKLDEAFECLDVLQQSVSKLHTRLSDLSMARLKPAEDALERSLMADSAVGRRDLAGRARDLFAESKNLYLELWKHACPWQQPAITIATAIEMKNRFVACAIGELQAEFICGDMGQFKHAARSAAQDYAAIFDLDAPMALRAHSDGACSSTEALARFGGHLPALSAQLRLATGVVNYTKKRLAAFEQDAVLPELLDLEPHQVARATRDAKECQVYAFAAPAGAARHRHTQ